MPGSKGATRSGTEITINIDGDKSLTVGETFQIPFTASDDIVRMSWYSQSPEVATVTNDGVITATGPGWTYISVDGFYEDGNYAAWNGISVNVYPASGIALVPSPLFIENGYSSNVTLYYPLGSEPGYVEEGSWNWVIADENLATITDSGQTYCNVASTGNGIGETALTYTSPEGETVTATVSIYKPIEDINFNTNGDIRLHPGDTFQLECSLIPEDANQPLIFESYDENVATIDENGIITAISKGWANINVRARYSGMGTGISIYVFDYPESVALEEGVTFDMRPDDQRWIPLIFTPEEYVDRTINWASADSAIAEVITEGDNNYYVKSNGVGTTTITGTTPNGHTVSFDVNVYTWFDEISVNPERTTLGIGDKFQIEYTTTPSNHGQKILFESYNPEVATVDEDGVITGIGYGETEIRVYPQYEGPSSYFYVQVAQMPESVEFENTDIQITRLDNSYDLNLRFYPDNENVSKDIVWTVSEEGIVEIFKNWNNSYYIVGRNFGTVTITGTTPNGLTVEGTVTVSGIKFDNTELNLSLGETVSLGMTASSDEILNAINWNINDNNVVSVSQNGEMTALAYGETWVWANANVNDTWYESGVHVTVHPSAGSVAFNSAVMSMQPTEWRQLQIIWPIGEDANVGTWSSSDENVVRVENGNERWCEIYGVTTGTATVTFTTANGATASCEVTVYTQINDFTLNAEQANLVPGETFQIEVTTDPENAGQTFKFRSENEEVATVDANGLVTAVGYGETEIAVNPVQQGWPTRWFRVNVAKMPESIVLKNPIINITELDNISYALDIKFFPEEDNVCKDIKWTFSEEGIIEIRSWNYGSYNIIGNNFGSVNFIGTTPNGLTVEGTANVSGIKFGNVGYDLSIGQVQSLDVTTSSEEIRNAISWRVDNTDVVSVSQDGIMTALSPGYAWVVANAVVNDKWYNTSAQIAVHPKAGSVAMGDKQTSIEVNNSNTIRVIFPIDENYDGVWSSSNENIVRIEDTGWNYCNIYGVTAGTATLTYTAANGASASCEVTVYTHINDFTLNAEQANLVPGETFQIEVTTDPENAGQTFNYRSENEEVATVDANGLVTAVGYGETRVYVNPEQQGWPTRSLRVIVAQMPESVTLENPNIEITAVNYTYGLDIKFSPDNDEINKAINWVASEEGIIDFGDWGSGRYYIVGRNFGTTTITGTTPNGLTLEGNVTVSGIKFENTDVYLSIGESKSLGVTTSSDEIRNALYWEINNPEIASVSEDGTVTALSAGEAVIYARAWVDGKDYYTNAWVYVLPEPGTVALNTTHITMRPENWNYVRVLFPEGEENYDGTWNIADESIARLGDTWSTECQVIAVAPGTTTLTYTAANGATASCEVTVYTSLNDFSLNASETTLGTGETFQIEIVYADPENHGQTFTYSSEDENIATVDENGLVTAVGAGETYIRVEPAQQGWPTRWLRVIVQQMPESFEILNPEITFNGIDIITLVDLAFTPDNDDVCKDLTWESSDPNIGYINKIQGKYYYCAGYNFGTANLTLTTANGLTQNAVINVRGIKIAEKSNRLMYMQPDESVQFTAEASSPEILEGYYWGANNPEVVSVDENGLATAHMYGEAQVNVNKHLDGVWYLDWVNIQVKPAPGTVGLNTESITMRVGEWNSIEAFLPAYEEDYWGSWSSSNDNVVAIDSQWNNGWRNGCEFQAMNPGEAVLTYTSNNGVTASCLVTVTSDVEAIVLNAYELNDLQPGDQFQIVAHTYPVETEAQFIYQSENSDVASVSEEGLLTVNGYGETLIHVYLADNASIEATIFVKVEAMPESIVIENNEIEVTNTSSFESIPLDVILDFPDDVEADEDYINDEIVWTCEPEGIVEVVKELHEVYDPVRNPMRKLSPRVLKERYVIKPTGRELGDVTVTGTTANGLTATANISVTGIAFPYGDMDLEIGENRFIDVKTIPEELAAMITYTVDNNYVADIENGIVVAKAAGYTTVYATAEYNGATYSSSFNVNVRLKDPTGVTALKESITLSLGEKVTYAVKDLFEVEPAEDVNDYLYISNGNYNIVNMNEEWTDGQRYITLEAINEGESRLDAFTVNWYYAQIPVYVVEAETAISLNEEFVILPMLTQKQLVATVTPSDREGEIKWTSSNPWSVSVDENGVITAKGIGSAIITASFTDQYGVTVSATCEVYVPFFSGVEEILEDGETCDIFTVDGIVLKKNASTEDLKSLTNGVYVIKKGTDTFKIKI